ncbi:rhodanese-related sulfurtransferase [Rhodovulum sp. 12E13]|uniref:oxygen-dependent tRNA uridine(34) hydroxylase TrhO n=1 Tax=Rhodovulum sp. 12E13 TaxID=2203891 RepID=UPI000E17E65C|nr:rhodanese-related sulfurtransferase [Rhodovulum sp. 12E13]RDC74147.1 rhodanese-related sulfurtransferase [Rhodovulum sp. 12E13]
MVTLAAFYRFADLPDPAGLRDALAALGRDAGVRGTVLLAAEGVNGTIAGPEAGVARLLDRLSAEPGLAPLRQTRAEAEEMPFSRLKVRVKPEIVTMGRPELRPAEGAGTYVPPEEWNALVSAPDVVLIDTRNAYEVALGTFVGAVDPGIDRFADFPAWWAANAHRFAGRRVAMFCTGGIRCEKSTALLRAEGVNEVLHLEGGILDYLARVPEADSRWRGECFVFDGRVSVGHGLRPGVAGICHACGRPVTPAQMAAPGWEEGVSCPLCISAYTDADRARFRERQRQVRLAAARGQRHLA